MTAVKDGVGYEHITPQLILGIMIVRDVFEAHGFELVITSLSEGKHMPGSLHYSGKAFDARSRTVPADRRVALLDDCRHKLTTAWDVTTSQHNFHFEWDP